MLTIPVQAHDHIQGAEDAIATLVEYGDYQCPYCRAAQPVVKQLLRRFGPDLRFVFRNFPLTQAHPLAYAAAQLAEAAALQDKFWPMHDWIFENQDRWSAGGASVLLTGAAAVGLDARALERALQQPLIERRIRADLDGGARSGVEGTPTFFLDGRRHEDSPQALAGVLARLLAG